MFSVRQKCCAGKKIFLFQSGFATRLTVTNNVGYKFETVGKIRRFFEKKRKIFQIPA